MAGKVVRIGLTVVTATDWLRIYFSSLEIAAAHAPATPPNHLTAANVDAVLLWTGWPDWGEFFAYWTQIFGQLFATMEDMN
jgi:hypothetical protein